MRRFVLRPFSALITAVVLVTFSSTTSTAFQWGDLGAGGKAMNCYSQVDQSGCNCQAYANVCSTSFYTDYYGDIVLYADYQYQAISEAACNATAKYYIYIDDELEDDGTLYTNGSGTLSTLLLHVDEGNRYVLVKLRSKLEDGCSDDNYHQTTVTLTRPQATTTTSMNPMGPYNSLSSGATVSGHVSNDQTTADAQGRVQITVTDPNSSATTSDTIPLSYGSFSWVYLFSSPKVYGTYTVYVVFSPYTANEAGSNATATFKLNQGIGGLPEPGGCTALEYPFIAWSGGSELFQGSTVTGDYWAMWSLPADLATGLCYQPPAGIRSDGYFWSADRGQGMIYKLDELTGDIVHDFPSPGPHPTGLARVGGVLAHADANLDEIMFLHPVTGNPLITFGSPGPYPYGLAWDGVNLWCADPDLDMIFQLDTTDGTVLYEFPSPGSHPTGLAWDGEALWCADADDSVIQRLSLEPPAAAFTVDIDSGGLPLSVQFIDQSTGGITRWCWEFGDGDSSTEGCPRHDYYEAGVYDVSLAVVGAGGDDYISESAYIRVVPAINLNVVGTFQTAVGDSANWDPAGNAAVLRDLNGDGVYLASVVLPSAGLYQYQVTELNTWDIAYPASNQIIIATADSQTVTWLVNPGDSIGAAGGEYVFDSRHPPIVYGDMQSELGGVDWDPTDTVHTRMHNDGIFGDSLPGDPIWTFQATIAPGGDYWFIVVLNNNLHQQTSPAGNIPFTSNGRDITRFTYDMSSNTTAVITIPLLCGDTDNNDIVNISDAVYLIAYIFGGGPAPDPLLSGDCDCNEIVNISDAVYLIAYIFAGGPEPCAGCPD